MGRLTQERIKQIVAAAANGASKAQLIEVAGVEKTTWWRWSKRAEAGDQPFEQMFKNIAKATPTGFDETATIAASGVEKRSRASVIKKQDPDLYRAVLAGSMTVNKAYELLKGKRRVLVPLDPNRVPAALSRHFSEDELHVIAEKLMELCA